MGKEGTGALPCWETMWKSDFYVHMIIVMFICSQLPVLKVSTMVCCAAWGCSNRSEKGVKMYGFPSDTKRRKKWLAQVSRRNFTITNDYNNKKLCQEHFHADQFVKTRKGKTRLRADAIPTIFVHRRVVKKRAPIPQCTSLLVNLKHIAVEHSYSVKGSTAYLSNSSTDASSPTNPAASLFLHPATPSAPTVLQLPLDAVNPKLTELHHNAERLPKTEENEWIAVIHGDTWNPGSELWISSCHSMSSMLDFWEKREMIPYTLTLCQVFSVSPPRLIKLGLSTTWKDVYNLKKFLRKNMPAHVKS
ncbi:uncharacterized protein LOC125709370 [Brienomyrus brachyistius]|uniref:uncharacterized protein LOC125709370 n=1 Tax=Brienomyrus brachyistius TaxID=42636 RepID=UPI0020B19F37|nr:uncharacterized protein LOC125709370 [Brienomyrus brachyistius]